MTERTKVTVLVEMPPTQRDELDTIAEQSGIGSRNAVIRLACREYAERFFMRRRLIDSPDGDTVNHEAA